MRRLRVRPGFTLLEVVVALAILAVSLMAVLDINAQAVATHVYAKKLTVATLLARSKMVDLEQKLFDEGLPTDDDEDSGDFSDEGWPSFKWRARILAPRTQNLTPDQMFGALFGIPLGGGAGEDPTGGLLSGMFGGGQSKDSAGGGDQNPMMAALGPMAAMAGQQFTMMVQQLQSSVREVHLTVSWKEGKLTESLDVVTHVVSMGPGSDRNGGAAAAAGTPQGLGSEQWVRSDNGQPVPNPIPASNGGGMVDPRDGVAVIPASEFLARQGGGTPQLQLPGGGARGLEMPGLKSFMPGGGQRQIPRRGGKFQ